MSTPATLARDRLKSRARELGFDLVGIAPALTPAGIHPFRDWLDAGHAGEMAYLSNRADAYEHPRSVLEYVRSVVMLAINYNTQTREQAAESAAKPQTGTQARVSRYAHGPADYHDVLRQKLQELAVTLHDEFPGCRTRGVVDTAPLLERDFGRLAGLGWFGKNTMLINKRLGSWFFLAALLTDVELEADTAHESAHCGTCTRCLDACPTDAFPEPYVLDARRCISYLNIELRGAIPEGMRDLMGDWLFGCDVCQEVCPWNTKAPVSAEPEFQPQPDLDPADAVALLRLDADAFRERFRTTPLWRPRRAGMLRNAAVVLGNCGEVSAVPTLAVVLSDEEPLVRGAVAWALGKLGTQEARTALTGALANESNDNVRQEIRSALQRVDPTVGQRSDAAV